MLDKEPRLQEGIADIKDLSFVDIFILQYLARYQGPVIRITLLETLNSFMIGNEMSPSSFYSRLKKLKKMGFVREEGERSRNQMIDVTGLALQALSRISQINMMGSIDFSSHAQKLIPQVKEDVPELSEKTENMLVINLEEGLDIETIKQLNHFAHTNYIAASDDLFHRYQGMGLPDDFVQSSINDKNTIREPDGSFDRVLIIGLECNGDTNGAQDWITEAYRLLKHGGLFVVASVSEPEYIKHFLLIEIVRDLLRNQFIKLSNMDDLRDEIGKTFDNPVKIKNYYGQLIASVHK